ncbi:hypothetical protein OROMI_007152 [Orobanche minor]
MTSSDLAPVVTVHYGIPSTASILAFDPIQRLLALGTLDGRIKVVGGDNIEGLLISPKALPFKSLEFLRNQGFLVSVSNENEIQVWDLVKRCISSNLQWESNVTAFSVISGTNYMYVGDEYGFLSVLKYDAEGGNILQLPYNCPANLIAEGAGVSLPDHESIVGVLSQPCSCGNRVLIAYENGLIILWDVAEDRAVHVKGYNDLQLKRGTVINFSDNENQTDTDNNELIQQLPKPGVFQPSHLADHDEQISKLQGDIAALRAEFSAEREEAAEFRRIMREWMKPSGKGAKPTVDESSGNPADQPVIIDSPFEGTPKNGSGSSDFSTGRLVATESLPWAVKKISLPDFYGFDPQGWLQKAAIYFDINGTPPHLRLRLAQLSMTGVATHWFTIVKDLYDPLSWEQFQTELLQRFSGLDIQNPFEQLSNMKQGDSIYDYIDNFEYLLSLVPKLPDSQSLGYFVAGLKEDVKRWVRLHRPRTRLDAMMLAKDVEGLLRLSESSQNHFRYQNGYGSGFQGGGFLTDPRKHNFSRGDMGRPNTMGLGDKSNFNKSDVHRPFPPNRSPLIPQSDANRNRGVRSLSRADWEDRRRKGLCYRCGLQFGPTHKCPEGKLRILLLGDDEVSPDDGLIAYLEGQEEQVESPLDLVPTGTCMALGFFGASSIESQGGKTLKFEGTIVDIPVVVMVDSGATHNFISRKLMIALGFSAQSFPGIDIRLGDGHKVFINQLCSSIVVKVADCEFILNALVFDMGHLDMVLGVEWLKTLGDVIHNWEQSTMKFQHRGREVCLQGLNKQTPSPASLQTWLSLPASQFRGEDGFMMGIGVQESNISLSQQQQLQQVCDSFLAVFRDPTAMYPLENEEAEKEISSLCWVSPDGSVLAVGYVDGDILLWNLSVPDSRSPTTPKSSSNVVKIQLSSGNRRLPVIVLHWSPNKAQNGRGGQLFAYGGEEIGSEEVLTILDLDWSSGLAKLKCVERVDLALHGSFADVITTSSSYKMDNNNATSLFVLTNPGQLHFYQYDSLSILKSEKRSNHSMLALQYHSVIPTVEPYMTLGKLYTMNSESNIFSAFSEIGLPAKQQSDDESTKWPLTGGVPYTMFTSESNNIRRIYIGGYQDGSIRIWDVTFPALSLVSEFGLEIKDVQVAGANASISALDFCSANLTLVIGNEYGVIFLCRLQGDLNQTSVTIVSETKHEVHHYLPEERNHCSTIYSLLNSPVSALQFATSGAMLVAGFECGQVAVLDTSSPSVLFLTDYMSSSRSPVISLVVQSSPDTHENSVKNPENQTESDSAKEIVIVLTRDAHMSLVDNSTGGTICSLPRHPKEKSIAISMYLLESTNLIQLLVMPKEGFCISEDNWIICTVLKVKHPLTEGFKEDSITSSQHIEAENGPLQSSPHNESDLSEVKVTQSPNLDHKTLASQILLCCEEAFYFYPLKSFIQGDNNFVHELKLEKLCSWTMIFKRDAGKYGLIVVYQTGEIEIRSIPELELLGNTSMMSILRWNFKTNMDKKISASDKGHITLVNGNEFAFVSLLASDNEFRLLETLPCLHDEVVAAAADADVNFSQNQKKSGMPGFVSNVMKGLKGSKEGQDMNCTEAREILVAHLEKVFSRFPFSDHANAYDIQGLELQIDDIDIDEPIPSASSSQKISDEIKVKGTEREKLFEGGPSDTKPTVRTREEIIAKYRKTGDATGAASQAKDKLMERQEKLEVIPLKAKRSR